MSTCRPHSLQRSLLLALLLAAAGGALAQGSGDEVQRIEVVGSRIPRIGVETALPVRVVTREEIERSGVINAEELLARISANFGGQNEAMGLGNADTPGLSAASLRGFGPGETLVLLNGRRLATFAFTGIGGPGVDLHAIPLAALQRVEVLKDGASALYGSDAIAGVVNFVTRKDFSGIEATLGGRATEHGGGGRSRLTLAAGGGDLAADRINLFGVLDLQRGQALHARDRAYAATSYRPELGLDSTSPASWPANVRLVVDDRVLLRNPAAPACTPDTVHKGNACWFDFAKFVELLQPSRQAQAIGRAALQLSPELEAHVELLASRSQVRYAVAPSPGMGSFIAGDAPFVLPPSSPYYPTSLGLSGPLRLAYRTVPLGPRTSEVTSRNTRLLAGLGGHAGGWDLDGALSLGDSRAHEDYLSGYLDARRLSQALATGLVNPFGDSGPEGEALLAGAQLHGRVREARGRTRMADLHASRELMALRGGPLALAVGGELRHEDLVDRHLAVLEDVVGGAPSGEKQGRRTVKAAYAELLAPVAKGVELQAAARWDHYSDFGGTVNPKLALRVQPAAQWLLRASAGRGFRAPSLPELYTQQERGPVELVNANFTDTVRCPVTHAEADCQPVIEAVSGGNPALRPQRSTQASAGMVWAPGKAWQASVDLWSLRVKDIIGSLDLDEVLSQQDLYLGRNLFRGPPDAAFPSLPGPLQRAVVINENLGQWRAQGLDLSLAMAPVPLRWGRLSMRFDGTAVHHQRQEILLGHPMDLVGRVAPRWAHTLSGTLERGDWSVTLSQQYRRGYDDSRPLPDGSVHHVAAWQVWDAQLAWNATPALGFSLGVHNLFDRDPPVSNQTKQFQLGYDPIYADPLGRVWSATLRLRWP